MFEESKKIICCKESCLSDEKDNIGRGMDERDMNVVRLNSVGVDVDKNNAGKLVVVDDYGPRHAAPLLILKILSEKTNFEHLMTQKTISDTLLKDYGISLKRRAISRDIDMLIDCGYDIIKTSKGSYLAGSTFDDSELRMLIDAVISSRHLTVKQSGDLIERLSGLSNVFSKINKLNVPLSEGWNKTENPQVFLNIDIVLEAIKKKVQITFDYNKFGTDKKLHKDGSWVFSPYQLINNNQRYYLMGKSEKYHQISFLRLDHITNVKLTDKNAFPIKKVTGFENGINYEELATAFPYLYSDRPEDVTLIADRSAVDHIVDWFGSSARFLHNDDKEKVKVIVRVSPSAMHFWALQYINMVEVVSPESLRKRITESLDKGLDKYRHKCDRLESQPA